MKKVAVYLVLCTLMFISSSCKHKPVDTKNGSPFDKQIPIDAKPVENGPLLNEQFPDTLVIRQAATNLTIPITNKGRIMTIYAFIKQLRLANDKPKGEIEYVIDLGDQEAELYANGMLLNNVFYGGNYYDDLKWGLREDIIMYQYEKEELEKKLLMADEILFGAEDLGQERALTGDEKVKVINLLKNASINKDPHPLAIPYPGYYIKFAPDKKTPDTIYIGDQVSELSANFFYSHTEKLFELARKMDTWPHPQNAFTNLLDSKAVTYLTGDHPGTRELKGTIRAIYLFLSPAVKVNKGPATRNEFKRNSIILRFDKDDKSVHYVYIKNDYCLYKGVFYYKKDLEYEIIRQSEVP